MRRLLLGIIAAASLAACAGNGNVTAICNDPAMGYFALLIPSPGATNVPDDTTQLLFDGSLFSNPQAPSSVVVTANGQRFATITTFVTTEILSTLSPSPSPLPSGPYLAGALPALSAHITYTVTYDYTISTTGACGGLQSQTLGSFTTQ